MTADNYIIFNNLIIGQTANDHSAEVNIVGRRIELQFVLVRLIMWCVCVLYVHTFSYCKNEREKAKGGESSTESAEKWRGSAEYCFLCLLSSFNTGSESVLLNPPAPWCVSKSKHTHTHKQKLSHTISTPIQWSAFFHYKHSYILNKGAETLETDEPWHKVCHR